MKSLYLMALAIFFTMAVSAQSFTGPATVTSGGTVTLTGSGESTSGYQFLGTSGNIDNSKNVIISPSGGYYYFITAKVTAANSFYNVTHSPTVIQVNFVLNNSTPVKVTVYIPMQVVVNFVTSIQLVPYTITVNPVSSGGTGSYRPVNGDFILDPNTGAQCVMWENTLRYIPNPATLNAIFSWNNNLYHNYTAAQIATWGIPRGPDFSTDSELISNPAGTVYLRQGNTIYGYPSPDVANTYHMNWSAVHQKVWSDGFYTIGETIWK